MQSTSEIGPSIGEKLRQDALIAIAISVVGIVLYISAQFELRFGIAAALAMVRDVLVVLGLFYLLNKEITLLVVTALLTLAGYSLTDKVVVFDRTRENLRGRRREAIEITINNGINQVLSRTIVTSLTVVLVLVPLALFGGEVLRDFSLALLWGVIIGTYSSVFVASPLLLVLPGGEGACSLTAHANRMRRSLGEAASKIVLASSRDGLFKNALGFEHSIPSSEGHDEDPLAVHSPTSEERVL